LARGLLDQLKRLNVAKDSGFGHVMAQRKRFNSRHRIDLRQLIKVDTVPLRSDGLDAIERLIASATSGRIDHLPISRNPYFLHPWQMHKHRT